MGNFRGPAKLEAKIKFVSLKIIFLGIFFLRFNDSMILFDNDALHCIPEGSECNVLDEPMGRCCSGIDGCIVLIGTSLRICSSFTRSIYMLEDVVICAKQHHECEVENQESCCGNLICDGKKSTCISPTTDSHLENVLSNYKEGKDAFKKSTGISWRKRFLSELFSLSNSTESAHEMMTQMISIASTENRQLSLVVEGKQSGMQRSYIYWSPSILSIRPTFSPRISSVANRSIMGSNNPSDSSNLGPHKDITSASEPESASKSSPKTEKKALIAGAIGVVAVFVGLFICGAKMIIKKYKNRGIAPHFATVLEDVERQRAWVAHNRQAASDAGTMSIYADNDSALDLFSPIPNIEHGCLVSAFEVASTQIIQESSINLSIIGNMIKTCAYFELCFGVDLELGKNCKEILLWSNTMKDFLHTLELEIISYPVLETKVNMKMLCQCGEKLNVLAEFTKEQNMPSSKYNFYLYYQKSKDIMKEASHLLTATVSTMELDIDVSRLDFNEGSDSAENSIIH